MILVYLPFKLSIMNIVQIKAEVAAKTGFPCPNLQMVRQFEEDGTTPTQWLSSWDNTNRIRVTMHEDVLNKVKAEPEFTGLALKTEIVPATADRAAYTRMVVITPLHIEATF